MVFISDGEIERKARVDFEVITKKKIGLPTEFFGRDKRECARRLCRDAQQEITVCMSSKGVGECGAAEQRGGSCAIIVRHPAELKAALDCMAASEPAQVLLEFIDKTPVPRIGICSLIQSGDAETLPYNVENAGNIRQVVGQANQPQFLGRSPFLSQALRMGCC